MAYHAQNPTTLISLLSKMIITASDIIIASIQIANYSTRDATGLFKYVITPNMPLRGFSKVSIAAVSQKLLSTFSFKISGCGHQHEICSGDRRFGLVVRSSSVDLTNATLTVVGQRALNFPGIANPRVALVHDVHRPSPICTLRPKIIY